MEKCTWFLVVKRVTKQKRQDTENNAEAHDLSLCRSKLDSQTHDLCLGHSNFCSQLADLLHS